MSKLEKRIQELEQEVSELKSQLLSLALRGSYTVYMPVPSLPPVSNPYAPVWPTYPTTTCGSSYQVTDGKSPFVVMN